MLFKNVASQKIHIYAYDSTTGAAKTGDAANITAYVSLDGTANAIDDTNPAEVDATNMPGIYVFDLAQAETNCNAFALYAKSATANIRIEPIIGFTTGAAVTQTADHTANIAEIKAKTDNLPTDPADQSAVEAAITAAHSTTNGKIDAVDDYVDTEIAAIKAKTDNLPASPSSLTAQQVWEYATRVLTAGTNIALAKGSGVTGFNDLDAAGIRTAVGLASANLDTQLGDLPTNAELAAATIARVTLVDTCTTNTDMRGTNDAALASVCTEARLSELDAGTAGKAAHQIDIIQTDTTTDIPALICALPSADAVKTAMEAAGSHLTLIKAKTDKMTYTSGNDLDVNVQKINDIAVTGTGAVADPWGPA